MTLPSTRALGLLGVCTVALLARVARAELTVQWQAPPSCAMRPEVATLGATGSAEVQLRELGPTEWIVTVLFFEPVAGLRRVTVRTCEEAVRTAALLVRLGSHGEVRAEPTAPPSAKGPVADGEHPRWTLSLSGGGALDLGVFPRPEPRFAVTVMATMGRLRLALDGRFGLLERVAATVQAQRVAELQGAGCFDLAQGRFSGGPCLAVAGGPWRAVTDSGVVANTGLLSVGPQARVAVLLLKGLEAQAVVGLRFNLRRPAPFAADGTLFTTGLVSGEFQLALGWRW